MSIVPASSSELNCFAKTAMLTLAPLSREECRTRLEMKGKTSLENPSWIITEGSDEYNRHRNKITLKLCSSNEDVVDVDDDGLDIEHDLVRYASQYRDGSIAAIVPLGRNMETNIKYTAVSRALCDVSLTKTSPGGKREVCMVDLATSPGRNIEDDDNKLQPPIPAGSNETVAAAALSMRKAPGKHAVYIDGELVIRPVGREVPLHHGAIISLYGPTGFAYEVSISQNDNKSKNDNDGDVATSPVRSPKRRKANTPESNKKQKCKSPMKEEETTPHEQVRHHAHQLMIGECTCAMCMDILVQSVFAYPCGHAFCQECSKSVTDAASPPSNSWTTKKGSPKKGTCPTCRGKVEGWMPARSFDTMVWSTALQGCFEFDDAEFYLSRREQCGEDAPTEHERECILNTADAGGNGGGADRRRYLPPDPSLQQPAMNLIKTLPPLFPLKSSSTSSDDVICID